MKGPNVYDSTPDTLAHIHRVSELLNEFANDLRHRAAIHDDSKLQEPEKSVFDAVTPKLKALTYGSDEYKASLTEMGVALQHHYAHNSHHPEHYPNGIADMTLMDIVEMLLDWKAATERHANGEIIRSIEQNEDRFGLDYKLECIFKNTAYALGWAEKETVLKE
jgi:hypothetical protein